MLLTISNPKPISTGWFVANCLTAGISDGCGRLLKDADPSTHAHTSTLQSKKSWSLIGPHICFHNSDVKDHDPEMCEHVYTKMFKLHGDVTAHRWPFDIHLDDEAVTISKGHPSYWRCHLESTT